MKHFYSCLILICLMGLAVSGCLPIKIKLSESELKWINIYNPGDTLIFKSTNNEYDTSFIVEKKIYYPEYIPIEVHEKYLPQTGVVIYKNSKLQYDADGDELIRIQKQYFGKKNQKTRLFINFLYAGIIVLDLNDNNIEKFKTGSVYEFDTYHPKAKTGEPKRIFWHENFGIIKYITHDNMTWERMNLSNY